MQLPPKTPVLFVHENSNYKKLPAFFDCYDAERNALTYLGTSPVICHPPCRLFSRLRKFSTAEQDEKKLAYWAVDLVRANGGVLEHPVGSTLWKEKDLPPPGYYDEYGGFTLCISQKWFGYYTDKKTLLYIVGIKHKDLPGYPLTLDAPVRKFENLSPKQRSETTLDLALYLGMIANQIKNNYKS